MISSLKTAPTVTDSVTVGAVFVGHDIKFEILQKFSKINYNFMQKNSVLKLSILQKFSKIDLVHITREEWIACSSEKFMRKCVSGKRIHKVSPPY